ncbi:MAG: hypothetical protein FJW76_06650 [Actinobacteria bacterium]|nr:hypothetical protein [Actinomycetota bacterium]
MKKLAILLIFLSLTRIGVAYAVDDNLSNIRGSYFFGTSSREGADVVNSVLALLIGPEGKPGLLGPEGKSAYDLAKAAGFPGTEAEWLVSLTGKTGDSAYDVAVQAGFPGSKEDWLKTLIGAPGGAGATGAAGASVTVEDEPSGANCTNGGKKLTSATRVAYVCNGTNGTGGGGSGGGSIGYGAGEVTIGACTDTATVGVKAQFNGSDFVMENLTISGLQNGCAGKTFNFYYAIDSNTAKVLKNPANVYTHGNTIKCTLAYPATTATKVPAVGVWGTAPNPHLTITSSNSTCRVVGGSTDFTIDKISTADYTNKIAFEILSS